MARARGSGTQVSAGTTYWLISDGSEPPGVLVVDLANLGRSLPVFSFREEAELFLALGGFGDGWRAKGKEAGDFLSLFFGSCADVKSVVLDPLPAMLRDSTAGLVGLSLDRFMDRFLGVAGPNGATEPG